MILMSKKFRGKICNFEKIIFEMVVIRLMVYVCKHTESWILEGTFRKQYNIVQNENEAAAEASSAGIGRLPHTYTKVCACGKR
jgi:hypothetical protein